jgi:hypothetical protein
LLLQGTNEPASRENLTGSLDSALIPYYFCSIIAAYLT